MTASLFASADQAFVALRPRLFAIAYRMLGMRASYTGYWLPEPLVEADIDERTPETAAEQASNVSVALLWVLERLAPEERAAFLLRQVFDEDYSDIAATLGRSEASCRQIVHRAVERVRQQQPRFDVSSDSHRALLGKFMQAAGAADRAGMKSMLAPDVSIVADGGGKVNSFLRILRGAGRIAGVYWALEHAFPRQVQYRMARINGAPGLLRYVDGQIESAQSFTFDDGRIAAIYIVRNPDKLRDMPPLITS